MAVNFNNHVKPRKTVSFLVSGRHAIIKNYLNGTLLLLYSPEVVKDYSFKSILKSAFDSGAVCAYMGPNADDFEEKFGGGGKRFRSFLLTWKNLDSAMQKMNLFLNSVRSASSVFVVNDFVDIAHEKNFSTILAFQKKIREKALEQRMHCINAFDISSLDSSMIETLASLNSKTIFTSDSEMVLSFLPEKSGRLRTSFKFFPHSMTEQFVKYHLEHIVYSMLLQKPVCGNDVIKRIASDYHVALSQGTVYPVFYSLHKKGVVTVANCSKSKMYSPTEDGRREIKKELSAMREAHAHFLSLFSGA